MKILFDMASVMWTGLRKGVDKEAVLVQHNGKPVQVNSAAYGYENAVGHMVSVMERWNLTPKDCILVFEGKDSKKRRCMIDPAYKAKREADKPPEMYIQYNLLKDKLASVLGGLGAIGVTQAFVEGDDVLAYLALNAEEDVVVSTNDNDLAALNGVNPQGFKIMVAVGGEVGHNKYGGFDFALITLYKSLVGDSSDNVKGCPGFGPAAFLNLIAAYGEDGAYELMGLIRTGQRDALAVLAKDNSCKILQKVVDAWDEVVKSYRVVLLHPEWVNTIRQQLVWTPGMVRGDCEDERLQKWQAVNRLVTSANFASRLEFLKAKLGESASVGFDIETSTPDESDDWLEAQGNVGGVDVFGSYLVGFSLTFGVNNQYTYYVSVKHKETPNITMVQAREMIEAVFGKPLLIQNTSFELSVLYSAEDEDGSLWRDHWAKYGECGFLPNVRDTMIEGSYVNENVKLGLKFRSSYHLGYEQATFEQTTRKTGPEGSLPAGGRRVKLEGVAGELPQETRQYKMHELTAREVFGYGVDDTICTVALGNFYNWIMQIEHTWQVYRDVELGAAYQHAKNYVDGVVFSLAKMKELEAIDDATYDKAWGTLRSYLIEHAWDGTVAPVYNSQITVKEIKEAYLIVSGAEDDEEDEEEIDEDDSDYHKPAKVEKPKDPILSSRVRTPVKLIPLLRVAGQDEFADKLEKCLARKGEEFTEYVQAHFKGEPRFKMSNRMMCKLLYETMALPIRVRNKPTATMKAAGLKEGNPKGDALAVAYALRDGTPEQVAVLEALKLIQMVKTRRSLYYSKYPYLLHWKDGKIHSSHNQCATNTRRASSSGPNLQQLPKHQKIEGQPARFRETFVPHKPGAVVVSMDFAAQELRVIADYSQDANMLACFVGDKLKDMHALTGMGIMAREKADILKGLIDALENKPEELTEAQYIAFVAMEHGTPEQKKLYKHYRSMLGKKVNFTTEYGAGALKLAVTLLVDEADAQIYIDAREDAFPRAKAWKLEVVDEAKSVGYVKTMLGAVRHLSELLNSDDRFTASKAERQAVNFKIQSSSAEMTKLSEGRMWKERIFTDYDAVCYGPIHDEVVASIMIEDLPVLIPKMHGCMAVKYADMQVPILSSISFGRSFGEQVEIGNLPELSAIAAGLEEVLAI